MTPVRMLMTVLVQLLMSAACAEGTASQQATATAMATSSTPLVCAVEIALQIQTRMVFVTTWTTASERLMSVAFATALVPSMSVDAQTSQRETAIAMETKKTHWAFVVEIVTPMLMQMAFVTMKMTA